MSERPLSSSSLTLRVRAEAAAWLAGLRRSNRTLELEGRFRRWLAESESNRIAWERQSEAWDLSGALLSLFESARGRVPQPRRTNGRFRTPLAIAAVLSAALVAMVLAWLVPLGSGTMRTAVGERRVTDLPDGSRVTLNTDTRIVVRYDSLARRVWLVRGEALFDVTKGQRRPFVVMAGTRSIRAMGTAFEVRRDAGDEISVTLIDGRISIEPIGRGTATEPSDVTIIDSPGERVTFAPDRAPRVDHPVLRQIIAWQSGDVVFNDTPLPDAAREMNRYSETRIRVEGPGVEMLHVGGLFQAGESVAFARAIAETFGLGIRNSGREIILSSRSGEPRAAPMHGSKR